MAVTKQTYTATATWTAAQLADAFRSAFIDAGLMTDWFDAFANGGVENRVLRIVNDASKTYGTVFYWFQFTTAGVWLQTATDWNAATDAPAGTQYLDFYATTTSVTTNHRQLISLASTTTATVTRYCSAINASCSWFLVRQGASSAPLLIPFGGYTATSFVDQNKVVFNGALTMSVGASGGTSFLTFIHAAGHLRKTFLGATHLNARTSVNEYLIGLQLLQYAALGNASNSSANISSGTAAIWLPSAHANTQTALGGDHTPVFTSIQCSPYIPALPADFGVAAYYASNAITIQDTLVVSAGVEEWEMISVANNATAGAARMMLMARVVG